MANRGHSLRWLDANVIKPKLTMSYPSCKLASLAGLIGVIALSSIPVSCANVRPAHDISPRDLDAAISSLKNMVPNNVDPNKLTVGGQQAKQKAIENAWRVIEASGQTGIQRLKEEAKRPPAQSDNFFKLNVARFLWMRGRWQEWHRLGKPLDAPIKAKHLVAAATPADIELLQEVKAAVLMRLSDEAYYEAREIDWAVEYLGRSRYRKEPGVTEKAELLQ